MRACYICGSADPALEVPMPRKGSVFTRASLERFHAPYTPKSFSVRALSWLLPSGDQSHQLLLSRETTENRHDLRPAGGCRSAKQEGRLFWQHALLQNVSFNLSQHLCPASLLMILIALLQNVSFKLSQQLSSSSASLLMILIYFWSEAYFSWLQPV